MGTFEKNEEAGAQGWKVTTDHVLSPCSASVPSDTEVSAFLPCFRLVPRFQGSGSSGQRSDPTGSRPEAVGAAALL